MTRSIRAFLCGLMLLSGASASAQFPPAAGDPPSVNVTGTGRVTLEPDHVSLRFAVQGMGSTGSEASAQALQRIAEIVAALQAAGIHADSVQQGGLVVGPSGETPISIRRPNEYSARSELRVNLWKLGDMPAVVDAALGAGATGMTGAQYGSTMADSAHSDALGDAFNEARASAQALAAAAGRRLGEIMWMSTSVAPQYDIGPSGYMALDYMGSESMMMGRSSPREVVVRAVVHVRWRLEK